MDSENLIELEHLIESATTDAASFEKLLSDMDHDTAYELVSQYGGMRPALHALRNMSFRHKTPITGKAKSYIRSASKRFKDAWSSRAVPVRRASGNPNIKFEFAQPVRTLDGKVKGRAHQFKGWSEEHKDFMYSVLHDGVKGTITIHPESTLKSSARTRVRTSAIKRLSESQLDLFVENLLEGANYVDLLESMRDGGNEKSDLVGANNAMNFSNPTRRKKRDWRSKRSMGDGTEKEGRTTRELRNRLARAYGSDPVKEQLESCIEGHISDLLNSVQGKKQ